VHRKPIISWGIGFVDNFQGGCDSVFGDNYWVKRDCVHRQNQVSAGEVVLVTIFELVETLSVTISKSTGIVCADQSRRQLWRQSR